LLLQLLRLVMMKLQRWLSRRWLADLVMVAVKKILVVVSPESRGGATQQQGLHPLHAHLQVNDKQMRKEMKRLHLSVSI